MFKIIQGHQITDEELYRSEGDIPVLTGMNEIKGYWNNKIVNEADLPCITYPSKANSGQAYIQEKIFDANNTAVLIPFPEWREKIDLRWLAYKLSKTFLNISTSKGGINYLNKEIVEENDIEIPPKKEQIKEYKAISKILKLKEEVDRILQKIQKIRSFDFIFEYKNYQAKEVPAKEIFECISGNSDLTEEHLYQDILSKDEKKYIILTGSIKINENQKTHLRVSNKRKGDKIRVFFGEGIHVIRKGKAGYVNYLKEGHYTLNDDAYILKIKDGNHYKISLKWFIRVYSIEFLKYASKSDNGTWNKSSFFKHAKFDIPSLEEQNKLSKKFGALDEYEPIISSIVERVDNILNREITYVNS